MFVFVLVFLFPQRFDTKKVPVIISTVRNNGCKANSQRLVKFNFQADISNFTHEGLFLETSKKSRSWVKLTILFSDNFTHERLFSDVSIKSA